MKACTKCKEEKSLDSYYLDKKRGYYFSKCKKCCSVDTMINRQENSDTWASYARKQYLKKNYGITPEQYNIMLQEQFGVCAICGNSPRTRRLAVDHCHKTGQVRGLLCPTCNRGLAWFRDNPNYLQKASEYVFKSHSK